MGTPKDYRDHSKEVSSSTTCRTDLISRKRNISNFSFYFLVKKIINLITFKFRRYEMVRVTENWLEPPVNERGLFSYLWDQVRVHFIPALLTCVKIKKIETNRWKPIKCD